MSLSAKYFSHEDAKKSLGSKLHRFELLSREDCTSKSVFNFLSQNLSHISPESWQARISLGGLYYNGRRIEEDRELTFPCKIEYYEPCFNIEEPANVFPHICENNIIFRRQGLIAVFKPAGLPSMPAKDQKLFNLRDQLKKLLGENSDIHLPSRLDTSVSGLILLSEERKLHNKLQLLYANQQIQKKYLALVSPVPDWEQIEINDPIARNRTWGVLREINTETGKVSQTFVKKLKKNIIIDNQDCCLMEVLPKTGRTHQIRVHLAHRGSPIVGDRFYCGLKSAELHLISQSVFFKHPLDHNNIEITIPEKLTPKWASQ